MPFVSTAVAAVRSLIAYIVILAYIAVAAPLALLNLRMSSLFLLAACLLLGWLVARFGHPPATLAQNLNWWVINVAFPALVLHLAPQIRFDAHLWFLIAALWFVFAGAWVFFAMLGRVLHWTRARIGALILVCGLGNTSFIGFPLIEALRGQEGLTLAVLADQAGCFVALAVGGTLVAALYSGHSVAPMTIARRVLLFPPFVSLLVGAHAAARDTPNPRQRRIRLIVSIPWPPSSNPHDECLLGTVFGIELRTLRMVDVRAVHMERDSD